MTSTTSTTSKNWMWRAALATTLLAMTSTMALANPSAARAKKHYDKGVALMQANEPRDAYGELKNAYGYDDQPLYHVAYCEAAVAMDHMHFAGEACRGLADAARGTAVEARAEAAVRGWHRVQAADAAKWARASDDHSSALGHWQKAIKFHPAPEYYAGLCSAHQALDQIADAATACNKAAELAKGTKDAATYQAAAKKLAAVAAALPTAAQQVLLRTVSLSAISVAGMQTEGYIAPGDLKQSVGEAKACVDAVGAAKQSGIKAELLVEADFRIEGSITKPRPGSTPLRFAPFGNIEAMCNAKYLVLRGKDAADKLAAAQRDLDLIATGKELGEADIAQLTGPANDCAIAVDRALGELKLPGSTSMKVSEQVTVTLGDAKARVCQKLVTETERVRAEWKARVEAARQAKLAPFKKVIKGDKLRILEEEHLYEISGYGKGGVEMDSPAEYKKAGLWFIVMSFEGNDGWTHWRLRRYQFRGDKLVKTTEKTGRGESPPNKAYK